MVKENENNGGGKGGLGEVGTEVPLTNLKLTL